MDNDITTKGVHRRPRYNHAKSRKMNVLGWSAYY
jgi:hypothetical protein